MVGVEVTVDVCEGCGCCVCVEIGVEVLVVDGVKGEPIHIYDTKYNLYHAYKEIFKHWGYIMKISKRNIKEGYECPSIRSGFYQLRNHYFTKKKSLTNRIQYE